MAGHLWWIAKQRSKHIRQRVEIEQVLPLDSLWTVIQNGARALSTFRGGCSIHTRQADELYLCKELILLWAEELRVRRENSRVRKTLECIRKTLCNLNERRCLLRMEIANMDEEVVRLETMPLTELEYLEDKALEQFTGLFEERITEIELNLYIDEVVAEEVISSSQSTSPDDWTDQQNSRCAASVSPQGDPPEQTSSKDTRRVSPQGDPPEIASNKQIPRASPQGDLPERTTSKEVWIMLANSFSVLNESHALLLKTSREVLKTTKGEEIFLAEEPTLNDKLVYVGGADPVHCYSALSLGGRDPINCYSTLSVEGDAAAKTQVLCAEPTSLFDFDGRVQKQSHEIVTCESMGECRKIGSSSEILLAAEVACKGCRDEISAQKSLCCKDDGIVGHIITDLSQKSDMSFRACDGGEVRSKISNLSYSNGQMAEVPKRLLQKASQESSKAYDVISQEVGYLVQTLPDPEMVLGDAVPENFYTECPELRWIASDRNSVNGLTTFDEFDFDKDVSAEDNTLTATDDTTFSRSDTITMMSELDDCTDTTELNDDEDTFEYPDLRLDNFHFFPPTSSVKSASPVEAFMHFMYGEEISGRSYEKDDLPVDPRASVMCFHTGDELLPKVSIEDFTAKFCTLGQKDAKGPSMARESDTSISSAPEMLSGGEHLLGSRLLFPSKDELKKPEKKESFSAPPSHVPKDGYPPKKVKPRTTIAIPGQYLEPHVPSTSCSNSSDTRVPSTSKSGHESRSRKDRPSRSLRRRLRLRKFFCFAFL